MTTPTTRATAPPDRPATTGPDVLRASAFAGLMFAVLQVLVAVGMALLVLPQGGAVDDPALERGRNIADAADAYRLGNYALMLSGTLILGFLGAVHHHLRALDRTGVLASVALAAGALLALVWPLAGMLHDVALETALLGTDPRLLAGWDAVAPYSLALSALPRIAFVGAVVTALQLTGTTPWLVRAGVVVLVLSLAGTTTLLSGAMFPVLALSTLAFEAWVGALAWHWLRGVR